MSDNVKGFTFTWEIENFSMLPHQLGEALSSDTFVVDQWQNSKCYLSVYPRGYMVKDTEGYISLYLFITASDRKLRRSFTLTVVSTDPSSDVTLSIVEKAFDLSYGFQKIVSLDNIYDKKKLYLPNDTLTLRCYIKPDERPKETVVLNESRSVLNFFRNCNSRTSIQVNRTIITLPVPNIIELGKRMDNVSFKLEAVSTKSVGLEITLKFAELLNEDFVKIEISQTNLPFKKEQIFVKCKMTVISSQKKYQDSNESNHLFQMSLNDIWHFPEFIQTSNLTPEKYLNLDTLLLQCEFAFSCKSAVYHLETNYTPVTFKTKEDRSVSKLVTNLQDLYLGGKFCDVELRAGDRAFPAHKVVLCAASPVFRAMFENDSKEKDSNVVEIEDVDPDTLRRMLAFVYSDSLEEDLSIEDAGLLFSVADKYDLDTLRRRCSRLLASSLSVENMYDVLVLADAHQDTFLVTAVRHFINIHSNETFYSEHWMRFMGLNPNLSGEIMHLWIKNRLK